MNAGDLLATDSFILAPIDEFVDFLHLVHSTAGDIVESSAVIIRPLWQTTYRFTKPAIKILFDITLYIFWQWLVGTVMYSFAYIVPEMLGIKEGSVKESIAKKLFDWSVKLTISDDYFIPLTIGSGLIVNELILPPSFSSKGMGLVEKIIGRPVKWVNDRLEQGPGLIGSALATAGCLWVLSMPVINAIRKKELLQGIPDLITEFGTTAHATLPFSKAVTKFCSAVKFTFGYVDIENSETVAKIVKLESKLKEYVAGWFVAGNRLTLSTWGSVMAGFFVLMGDANLDQVLSGNLTTNLIDISKLQSTPQQGRMAMAAMMAQVLGIYTNEEFKTKVTIVAQEGLPIFYWQIISKKPFAERIFLTLHILAIVAANTIKQFVSDNFAIIFGLAAAAITIAIVMQQKSLLKIDQKLHDNLAIEIRSLELICINVENGAHVVVDNLAHVPTGIKFALAKNDTAIILQQLKLWIKDLFARIGKESNKTANSDAGKKLLAILYRRLVDRRAKLDILGQHVSPETSTPVRRVNTQLARASLA